MINNLQINNIYPTINIQKINKNKEIAFKGDTESDSFEKKALTAEEQIAKLEKEIDDIRNPLNTSEAYSTPEVIPQKIEIAKLYELKGDRNKALDYFYSAHKLFLKNNLHTDARFLPNLDNLSRLLELEANELPDENYIKVNFLKTVKDIEIYKQELLSISDEQTVALKIPKVDFVQIIIDGAKIRKRDIEQVKILEQNYFNLDKDKTANLTEIFDTLFNIIPILKRQGYSEDAENSCRLLLKELVDNDRIYDPKNLSLISDFKYVMQRRVMLDKQQSPYLIKNRKLLYRWLNSYEDILKRYIVIDNQIINLAKNGKLIDSTLIKKRDELKKLSKANALIVNDLSILLDLNWQMKVYSLLIKVLNIKKKYL